MKPTYKVIRNPARFRKYEIWKTSMETQPIYGSGDKLLEVKQQMSTRCVAACFKQKSAEDLISYQLDVASFREEVSS